MQRSVGLPVWSRGTWSAVLCEWTWSADTTRPDPPACDEPSEFPHYLPPELQPHTDERQNVITYEHHRAINTNNEQLVPGNSHYVRHKHSIAYEKSNNNETTANETRINGLKFAADNHRFVKKITPKRSKCSVTQANSFRMSAFWPTQRGHYFMSIHNEYWLLSRKHDATGTPRDASFQHMNVALKTPDMLLYSYTHVYERQISCRCTFLGLLSRENVDRELPGDAPRQRWESERLHHYELHTIITWYSVAGWLPEAPASRRRHHLLTDNNDSSDAWISL